MAISPVAAVATFSSSASLDIAPKATGGGPEIEACRGGNDGPSSPVPKEPDASVPGIAAPVFTGGRHRPVWAWERLTI